MKGIQGDRPALARFKAGYLLVFLFLAALQAAASEPDFYALRASVVKVTVHGRSFDLTPKGIRLKDFDATGSGVVLDTDGYIMTAAHVLDFASTIVVTGPNGETSRAHPVAQERDVDIAVLQLNDPLPDLVPVTLASKLPKLGDKVWTLGHPYGLDYSLSRGIISGVRSLEKVGIVGWKGHILQTDAAMNPGVSGGGLFDSRGRLVGVAVSILTASGGFEGVGFGVALDAIKDVMEASPCVWLGMDAAGITDDMVTALRLPSQNAYLVQQVFPDSPADRAGIHAGWMPALLEDKPVLLGGDIIMRINGYDECRKACRDLLSKGSSLQSTMSVDVWRAGRSVTLTLPEAMPHVRWMRLFEKVDSRGE